MGISQAFQEKAENTSLLPYGSGKLPTQMQPLEANPFINTALEAAPPRIFNVGGGGCRSPQEGISKSFRKQDPKNTPHVSPKRV